MDGQSTETKRRRRRERDELEEAIAMIDGEIAGLTRARGIVADKIMSRRIADKPARRTTNVDANTLARA